MERVHDMLSLTVLLAADPDAVVRVDLTHPAWFHSNCVGSDTAYWVLSTSFIDESPYHQTKVWVTKGPSLRGIRGTCHACGKWV